MTDNIRLFALRNYIIVLKDVCRSKKAMKVSAALPLEGRRVVLKLMGLAKTKKGGRPITNFENPQF